jgi:CO/xanthine dehydrogenase FAD-binding subunit
MTVNTGALRPRSIAEAVAVMTARPDAVPVHGGTDVMVEVNEGRRRVADWISLRDVGELRGWRHADGSLHLGAGLTFAEILADDRLARAVPALARAARTVGSPQIRTAATIGGNIATASPAADGVPVLMCHDAVVELESVHGIRSVPLESFALGPKRTVLQRGELVRSIRIDPTGAGVGAFAKVGTRNAMVIAVCSISARLDPDRGVARVAIGSAAPTVRRATDAEALLLDERSGVEFAEAVVAASTPIDDLRATADYRRRALHVLARRIHTWLWSDLARSAA